MWARHLYTLNKKINKQNLPQSYSNQKPHHTPIQAYERLRHAPPYLWPNDFSESDASIPWGKVQFFFRKRYWGNWMFTEQKNEVWTLPDAKMNAKWLRGSNVRGKIVKLLEERRDVKLHDLGLGNNCMDMTSKAQADKLKIRIICVPKDTINRMQSCTTGKMFIHHIHAEELISIIYEEHLLFNNIWETA